MADPIYTKQKLSGSTNGKQIKIAATSSPGTLIHTACAGTIDWDEIYIYVTNNHTAAVDFIIQWGGTTSPDDLKQMSVPSKSGDYLVIPGHILNNGLEVRAYAGSANLLCVSGWVNHIDN